MNEVHSINGYKSFVTILRPPYGPYDGYNGERVKKKKIASVTDKISKNMSVVKV